MEDAAVTGFCGLLSLRSNKKIANQNIETLHATGILQIFRLGILSDACLPMFLKA
jgi:hypothetical protein